MKVSMFTYSNWFGNDIYISPNENVYALYQFGDEKCLIMDTDMTFNELKNANIFDLKREPKEIIIYWMYAEDYWQKDFFDLVQKIVAEYEENPEGFFKKYNSKRR